MIFMDLKKFLKPSLRKIIIFIILILLSFFVTLAYMVLVVSGRLAQGLGVPTFLERISNSLFGIPLLILSPFSYDVMAISYYAIPPAIGYPPSKEYVFMQNLTWLFYIFNLIYDYILSCFIIRIYDKRKKRK